MCEIETLGPLAEVGPGDAVEHTEHWQLIGDVLKLVNWPLGYVLIASGRGRSFALNEALANTAGIAALLPVSGSAGG